MNDTVTPSHKEVMAGQKVYNPFFLSIYDLYVLGISNQFIWKCPSKHLLKLYDTLMSSNHLDVGVGTGYFLAKSKRIKNTRRLGLLDLNTNSLAKCSARLKDKGPNIEIYHANVLDNGKSLTDLYDSVSLNFLLHCLPGRIDRKLKSVLTRLAPNLSEGAPIFGSTILCKGVNKSKLAEKLMATYNEKGFFSNKEDNPELLSQSLTELCTNITIEIKGCVAIFSGKLNN